MGEVMLGGGLPSTYRPSRWVLLANNFRVNLLGLINVWDVSLHIIYTWRVSEAASVESSDRRVTPIVTCSQNCYFNLRIVCWHNSDYFTSLKTSLQFCL